MNKIDKLIAELCPDGVEYKELGEVATIQSGGTPRSNVKEYYDGDILWSVVNDVTTADKYIDKTKKKITQKGLMNSSAKLFPKNTILLTIYATLGEVAITKVSMTTNQAILGLQICEDIAMPDFVYYVLKNKKSELIAQKQMGSQNNLNKSIIESFPIPIPPLAIQQEIVNILDKFTQLEAELKAELKARRTQYEYYRNKLLNFEGKEVEWKTLGEICEKTSNIKWQETQGDIFKYIDLSSVDRTSHLITEHQMISQDDAPSRAQKIIKSGDILFGTTRPTLKRFCIITDVYDEHICSTGFCVLRPKQNFVLTKWIYYFISLSNFYDYIEGVQRGASYPAVSDIDVKKYKIPIPPLPQQERIVAILDNFDKLVNNISQGLPAEIAARQKQYEYYRGKLLNFKELSHG